MTDKEFSKLSRQELLKLLLAQGREQKQLEDRFEEVAEHSHELEQSYERLKNRLDEKDEQIERLKGRLNDKDETILKLKTALMRERTSREIQLRDAGSIAEASLRLNGVFETAQRAADQYIENIRQLEQRLEAELSQQELGYEKRESQMNE